MSDSNPPGKAAVIVRNTAFVFLLLLPLAPLGANLGLWSGLTGFAMLAIAILGALLILIINAVWLLRKPAPASKRLIRTGTLLSLPALVVVIFSLATMPERKGGGDGPPLSIHNVTTAPENPPVFSDAVVALRGEGSNPLDYTSETAAVQAKLHPELAPLMSGLAPAQAYQQALKVARDMGWEVHNELPGEGIFEAVATTSWFAFKDDIVVRISATDAGGSRIDLRSVSRVGRGDMGANANRIQAFITKFQE